MHYKDHLLLWRLDFERIPIQIQMNYFIPSTQAQVNPLALPFNYTRHPAFKRSHNMGRWDKIMN
jgi:hypothetical protein